eukprot:SAG22_NODE_1107_length_5551_cov_9.040902_2_plen_119_part_00
MDELAPPPPPLGASRLRGAQGRPAWAEEEAWREEAEAAEAVEYFRDWLPGWETEELRWLLSYTTVNDSAVGYIAFATRLSSVTALAFLPPAEAGAHCQPEVVHFGALAGMAPRKPIPH